MPGIDYGNFLPVHGRLHASTGGRMRLQPLTSTCADLSVTGSVRVMLLVTRVMSTSGPRLPVLPAIFWGMHMRSPCRQPHSF